MSFSISIEARIPPSVKGLKPVPMEGVRRVAGRAVINALRAHFDRLDQERPNALGGRRTHFYRQVAHSIQQPRTEGENVVISINHVGAAQRFFGGTIRPVNAKYLTIPARAEAYGKRAGEFKDLEVLWSWRQRRPIALIQRSQTRMTTARRKGEKRVLRGEEFGGGVFFWLVKAVTQKADPTVLPPEETVSAAVTPAIQDFINAHFKS
jgi:hypothetical protein